ncbi:MAG: polyphenol oxidase family protein [Maricaulaceae bacterium]
MTLTIRRSSLLESAPGVSHGFFGRTGGVSQGVYDSLNTGPGSNDDALRVAENRRRAADVFGVPAERMLTASQAHTATAITVSGPWRGRPSQGDALGTRAEALVLGALAADCAPILMVDPQARVVGAVHAGWRGALDGVLSAGVAAMVELGAARDRVLAAVGPCIGWDSYEIGPDFKARFLAVDRGFERFFKPGPADREHFDLPGFAAAQLAQAGVGAVDVLEDDVFRQEEAFFSSRRAKQAGYSDYGRNLSAICLTPNAGLV